MMLHTSPNRFRRGYALLVTLVMLALLAVILGGLARRSVDTALLANDREQATRQQWAERSCGHTLLVTAAERADQRLERWLALVESEGVQPEAVDAPVRSEAFYVELAGLHLWGRIDDEQAKINLNQQLAQSPDARVSPQIVVDDVLRPARSSDLRLTRQLFVEQLGLPRVMSWGQVLPGQHPTELLGVRDPEQLLGRQRGVAVVDRVTLWGDGRLNLWTADRETIRRQLADTVAAETIASLLELHANEPTLDLGTLITNATAEQEQEQERDRSVLTASLTDRSSSYSLWLATRPSKQDAAAARWSLRILESGQSDETSQRQEYRW